MAKARRVFDGVVEAFPAPVSSSIVTDELTKVLSLLRQACPEQSIVTFTFDGKLRVHIDVKKREEVMLVEALLPTLAAGLFGKTSVGGTPQRPFMHRISAPVTR